MVTGLGCVNIGRVDASCSKVALAGTAASNASDVAVGRGAQGAVVALVDAVVWRSRNARHVAARVAIVVEENGGGAVCSCGDMFGCRRRGRDW